MLQTTSAGAWLWCCCESAHRKAEHIDEVRQPRVCGAHKVVSAVQQFNVQQELQRACAASTNFSYSGAAASAPYHQWVGLYLHT